MSVATAPAGSFLRSATPRPSLWREATRRFRRHRLAMIGFTVLFVMVAGVLAGPFVYRVPIDEIDFKAKLKGPSRGHPLGTDDLGQDLLARVLYGGRISLAVGVVAMLISITIGTGVGALAGQLGGAGDHTLMRITDLFLSLPQLPLLLLVVYLLASVVVVQAFEYAWASLAFWAPRAAEEINSHTWSLLQALIPFPLDGLSGWALGSLLTIVPAGLAMISV